MKIKIISVGKKSSPQVTSLCAEYEKRLARSHSIDWCIVDPIQGKMTLHEQTKRESRKIEALLTDNDNVVLLDERGSHINNEDLAKRVDQWALIPKSLAFVIGGAFGVSEDLRQRADFVWSLSSLVLPHEIVRLVLVEQIYRAQTINEGLPYHHE